MKRKRDNSKLGQSPSWQVWTGNRGPCTSVLVPLRNHWTGLPSGRVAPGSPPAASAAAPGTGLSCTGAWAAAEEEGVTPVMGSFPELQAEARKGDREDVCDWVTY